MIQMLPTSPLMSNIPHQDNTTADDDAPLSEVQKKVRGEFSTQKHVLEKKTESHK